MSVEAPIQPVPVLPGAVDICALNAELEELTPTERIARSDEVFGGKLFLPISFNKTSPVLLKMVLDVVEGIDVATIRHGYEDPRTLELADYYENRFNFKLLVKEAPRLPIPEEDTAEFGEFQREVKVEPFQEILDELLPRAYFSGRMRWQSPERANLPFVEAKGSVVAVNPIADLSQKAVQAFLREHDLPIDEHYFDPTKGLSQNLECQLNTTAYR